VQLRCGAAAVHRDVAQVGNKWGEEWSQIVKNSKAQRDFRVIHELSWVPDQVEGQAVVERRAWLGCCVVELLAAPGQLQAVPAG
jgi:hypothetical protein